MTINTTNPPRVREVEPAQLRRWMDAGEAILIDVREADENARESIPGSLLLPLSRFDPAALRGMVGPIVFHCQSGRRSAEAACRAVGAPGRTAEGVGGCEVYTLRGGLQAWRAAGLPLGLPARRGGEARGGGAPIPIMRQVQIAAGSAVLVGSALAALSPWFLVIPAFIGGGLVFAGVTGTCGLAGALVRMPWNRGGVGSAEPAARAASEPRANGCQL